MFVYYCKYNNLQCIFKKSEFSVIYIMAQKTFLNEKAKNHSCTWVFIDASCTIFQTGRKQADKRLTKWHTFILY